MFFTNNRSQFFKPLVGKYREHIYQCLALLYTRQYGASADYGHSLKREQAIEIIEEALVQSSDLSVEQDEFELDTPAEERFKTTREQANWILNQLIQYAWIERQVDPATLQSTFPFSRLGRVFAQALLEADSKLIRTRHRNTRNTLNALDAFVKRSEVYDLLDAYDYSERIVTDFTDVISELEEKKRDLVQEMESQQLVHQAAEQFFDFMEKRFQPDIQVRLAADSVEKHRDNINKRISSIRRKSKEFKANAERDLRRAVPNLCDSDQQSYLYHVLDTIERRMHNAAEVMLPALRSALHGFTKRADIIIRQLSYFNAQQESSLIEVCKELADLSEDEYNVRIRNAADSMATFNLRLIDPQQIKLTERKKKDIVDGIVIETELPDRDAQCELMIQQLLDQAFVVNRDDIKDHVLKALRDGKKVSTRDLNIVDAPSLLTMAHAIEIGNVNGLSSDMEFKVTRTNKFVEDNEFYQRFDEHEIELIRNDAATQTPLNH